jgi:hypothetical protein
MLTTFKKHTIRLEVTLNVKSFNMAEAFAANKVFFHK